jgi:transposase
MSSVPVFVGLDYHQDAVQVCVLNDEGKILTNRSVDNDVQAVNRVATRHGRPVRIAIEACCGAANLAQQLSDTYHLPIELGHPGYVSRMKGSPDKSDFSDAQLLADLTRVNYLPKVWLAPDYIRQLRHLSRHREQLVRRKRNTKLRIRALLRDNRLKCEGVRPWTKAWLAWLTNEAALPAGDRWIVEDHLAELASLTKRLATVEKRVREFTAEDGVMAHLLTLEGVGLATALTLRAEIGCFERFRTGKQLARFCSVSPRNASSGHRQADAGMIKAGNPQLRAVLVELAHRLVRGSGPWAKKAAALLARGKQKNVVVAAIANRWTRWLHHEMQRFHEAELTSALARQKGAAPTVIPVASTAATG